MKLGDRFQAEKFNLSYADLHYEITKDVQDTRSLDDQKRTVRSTNEDDELVKYMSNLPSFLKRGENIQEKTFSVGVLDWGRLEKWQHSHKQTVHKASRYFTSSTSTSSSHSTEASSSHSSRGRSCSPINQRMHQPTLRPSPIASLDEHDVATVKPTGENAFVVDKGNSVLDNYSYSANAALDQTLKLCPEDEREESEKRELNPKMFQKIEASKDVKGNVVRSCSKEKKEVQLQECKSGETVDLLEQSNAGKSGGELAEWPNRIVILLPRNVPSSGKFEVSQLPDSTASSEQKSSAGRSQGGISGKCLEVHRAKFDSNFVQIKQRISLDASPTKLPLEGFCPVPAPARASVSPRTSSNVQMRPSNVALLKDDAGKPSKGLDSKTSKASSEKPRSTSPFRRLTIGVGKIVKSSNSKEVPTSSDSSSLQTSVSSCLEKLESSATSPARSRSSPLRRLLDPLLKPKVSSYNHSDYPSRKTAASIGLGCNSSKGRPDSTVVQPGKAKLDLTGRNSINVDNSHLEKNSGLPMVQALLRVAFKNGFPLFTFAVDNDGDILAATMKECSSSSVKDNRSWIYTFLTIREVKKKNGIWINQGGKSKCHDYVPSVVAQMKVSDSRSSNLREFVLFSVEPRKQNQSSSDFKPNDELAAIVCQIPLRLNPCSVGSGHQGVVSDDMDHEDLVNTTVILPSGVHSLPSKGGPSSLIQRWRSGGSCDCGGWDLGCQLKVLSGDHHPRERVSSSEAASAADLCVLFPQVDTQENLPELTLALFKDGIYSIEFNSSLSVLQTFSACIAVLESRKMIENLEDPNLSVGKSSGVSMHSHNGDLPGKYISNPPLSPAGRVLERPI
ncbi:uncharacterized protein LOC116211120 [Punica granatum]|uniref:Uncharacterized protein n=2 Tax=Punica granatum TaxID=22663 RepID=A0A2I0KD91_PUNGR|nr:uncharacterized protein LOC116211120 [Punica granatum]PKI66488.1 hypothetical protein CRG98_013144 [Punica granatum]